MNRRSIKDRIARIGLHVVTWGIAVPVAAYLIYVVMSASYARHQGWHTFAIFIIILAVIVSTILGNIEALKLRENVSFAHAISQWIKAKRLNAVIFATYTAIGVSASVVSLFQPSPAVESKPFVLENNSVATLQGVNDIRAKLAGTQGGAPRILSKISGVWGEPGCAVTYRISAKNNLLTVESLRVPPGASRAVSTGAITLAQGDTLNSTIETPLTKRGYASVFTFIPRGIGHLQWQDLSSDVTQELDNCAGPALP